MQWAKRIVLFLVTNLLVVLTLSIVLQLLGVNGWFARSGIDYRALAVYAFVWGMGGSLISLALSRIMARFSMGVRLIDPNTSDPAGRALVDIVYDLSRAAGLPKMPQVGIYDSPEVNAFATGPTKSRALVAVSTGLLRRMDRGEIEGVLGHEIGHVANGDMVTMTLLQGIVNAFVMFAARALAFAVSMALSQQRRSDDDDSPSFASSGLTYLLTFVFELVFMVLGSLVVAAFSRWREYRADAEGARLAGRGNMISALEKLRSTYELRDPRGSQAVAALKISGGGVMKLFSTHPPLDERIARLRAA